MAEIVNKNPMVTSEPSVQRGRSNFDLMQTIFATHRFGEIVPHLCMDGVDGDNLPLYSADVTKSYTLKAPLMQDIEKHKDYFMVTLRSILPYQAERVITNPNIGDDVPGDAYTSVDNFNHKIRLMAEKWFTWYINPAYAQYLQSQGDGNITHLIKCLLLLESIYSEGSLLASLGCSMGENLTLIADGGNGHYKIDEVVDMLFNKMAENLPGNEFTATIDGKLYHVCAEEEFAIENNLKNRIPLRIFIQKIRETGDWSVTSTSYATEQAYAEIASTFGNGSAVAPVLMTLDFRDENEMPIDIGRLWAYHLACAEFFTNDKVDYIYSADLYRQYIADLEKDSTAAAKGLTFTWNGLELLYDILSAKYFDTLAASFDGNVVQDLQYMYSLFGFHRSLRYLDYYTGSRTRPLAVGDTSVAVNSNLVSVIDITRKIQTQKFLNFVNVAGRKFSEYMKELFGVEPNKDMHEPIFLAHTTDTIYTTENENTGAQQRNENALTANFIANSGRFEFKVEVKENCYIIGVTSYDIQRAYSDIIERSFFTRDRFDMFIPQMQFVGDQAIYKQEIFPTSTSIFGSPFGYQFHDMQYKIMVNRAIGGFATGRLPGFALIFDRKQRAMSGEAISPDFIRSTNYELDQFYSHLTHFALGTYFHFYVKSLNTSKASRPMIAHPTILG